MNAQQRQVLQAINQATAGIGNPRLRAKIKKAAVETGIVESHLQNLHRGDKDSEGWRQERTSIYGVKHATNPLLSAQDFVKEALPLAAKFKRPGDLAAAVQRPAAQYRGRYQQVAGRAQQILHGAGGSSSTVPGASVTTTTPASTKLNVNQAILDTLSQHPKNLASSVLNKLAYSPAYTTHTAAKTVTTKTDATGGGSASVSGGHVVHVDGKPVAAWIANILQQAKAAGWTGTVSSGYRSVAEQRRIYNSGVRPAAKPGQSNHNFTAFPGGAVDVTNAAQLARVLHKLGITKLRWAGAKDPVHFSHPHNGGY